MSPGGCRGPSAASWTRRASGRRDRGCARTGGDPDCGSSRRVKEKGRGQWVLPGADPHRRIRRRYSGERERMAAERAMRSAGSRRPHSTGDVFAARCAESVAADRQHDGSGRGTDVGQAAGRATRGQRVDRGGRGHGAEHRDKRDPDDPLQPAPKSMHRSILTGLPGRLPVNGPARAAGCRSRAAAVP